MPPKKIRRRSSSGRRRRVGVSSSGGSESSNTNPYRRVALSRQMRGSPPPFLWLRRMQYWQAPPRSKMAMVPRDAQTMSTPPKHSSTSSAPSAPYTVPVTTVNDSRACSPSSSPTSGGMSPVGVWQPSHGESSSSRTRFRRSSGRSSCSRASPRWGKSTGRFVWE